MTRRLALLPLIAFLATAGGAGASEWPQGDAAAVSGEWTAKAEDQCQRRSNVGADVAIGACTALIRSGWATTPELAGYFRNRASAEDAKDWRDEATADREWAERLDRLASDGGGPEGWVAQWEDWCELFDAGGRRRPETEPDLAIGACTGLINSNDTPRDDIADLLANRGTAWDEVGELDRAIADFDRVIALDPHRADAFTNRGLAYAAKGEHHRAIPDFDAAIRLDPNDARNFRNRGAAYDAIADYERAIRSFDRALDLDPNDAFALFNRGVAKLYGRTAAAAVADFAGAVQLEPAYPYAVLWLHIARSRAGGGDRQELRRNLAAVAADPWPAPVAALFRGDGSAEAVRATAKLGDEKTRRGQECEADFYLAVAALAQKRRAEAKRLFGTAAKACPPRFIEAWAAKAELKRLGR